VSLFKKSNSQTSSRRQIDIKGVRDGVLILPDNKYRSVLRLSSINFELKSEAEQDALIDTYQSFLNSLATPLQIVVRIREMDMDKYLDSFHARMDQEDEQIYKDQVQNYTEFVRGLITKNKILSRHFYVILPFNGKEKDFEVVKEQLLLSADIVTKGLARLGMQAKQLDSLDLLDLFYSFYSPDQSKSQPLKKQTMQLLTGAYL
jgi:type IV secretory pathway VirB4 component